MLKIFVAPVIAFILAMLYFKKNPGGIKEGIILAIFWIVVGTILDLLITIQYVKGTGIYSEGLRDFYLEWGIWVSFILTIVAVAWAGKVTRGGELMKRPPVSP